MAFQQPQRPRVARPPSFSYPAPQQSIDAQPLSSPQQRKRPLDESEEWVLFSPSAASSTTRSHTASTRRSPRTAGISRFSDFASIDTAARSDRYEEDDEDEDEDEDEEDDDDDNDDITCQGTEDGETEELDSLDDGLRAFHEPSEHSLRPDESTQTVFPTHDGLGTFPASNSAMQEQLWQFERYNASSRYSKHQRRRSSVQRKLDALQEQEENSEQNERVRRIEKWRLEQSRALLDEIERETRRRRRMSRASLAKSTTTAEMEAGPSVSATNVDAAEEGNSSSAAQEEGAPENESFWQRFTRRVIRDLMGIDENLLSVILGESLPTEAAAAEALSLSRSIPNRSATQPQTTGSEVALYPGDTWEHRLLERIARELGILVHQLSEHPGAFTTYLRAQEPPPYAGIANATTTSKSENTQDQGSSRSNTAYTVDSAALPTTSYSEAALWGIEEEPEPPPAAAAAATTPAQPTTTAQPDPARRDREYWEQDLDVRMVFNFLKGRFSSRPPSPTNASSTTTTAASSTHASTTSPTPPASAAAAVADQTSTPHHHHHPAATRAALIRQHHPLVGRNLAASRAPAATTPTTTPTAQAQTAAPVATLTTVNVTRRDRAQQQQRARHGHSHSSCASQSTKKSKRSAGGSSRCYWDLGGSGVSVGS
ncbi:uncharacterized protein K452DRAFT_347925 [Aplosporella prunicola CBS 121167]|uniref:Uncharacterized protein n=1 Tax=Aplosporella prunicola CBS 121167 TaxID=1176127 RepID=A0A6A6BUX2_9PEZI|nr:uncharacterized protein K452DRAFT_347925 [Aplosporella prunicola CBS 121167]KAF2147075.1 hypothetical protein K452DRAFT_347925 [Aplosporella prunicola CBS 121167]